MRTENFWFEGEAGSIECAIDFPDTPPLGWALCLHPHPLFLGTNTNKVVTTLARSCVQQGFLALRPNFRGVGQSQGEFDHSQGETADMLALIDQFLQRYPEHQDLPWILGGFSFGTAVAAQVFAERQDQGKSLPSHLILLGPAVWKFAYRDIQLPDNTLLIHGEKDELIPIQDVYHWLQHRQLPLTVIPDSGHFFHGKLVILKNLLQKALRS